VARDVAAVPGVAEVSAIQLVGAEVDGQGTFLTAVDPATVTDMLTLDFASGSLDDLGLDGVAVDANTADGKGLSVGDQVEIAVPTGVDQFQVVAVYDASGGANGYVVSRAALGAAGIEVGDALVYVKTDPGADLATVQAGVEEVAAAYPTVDVQSQAQFKEQISSNVNQVLLVMVMLLSLAILIAVLGIVNTLVLSVIERTREIGMLRAVGALRRQIRTMVVLEALVIAVYGAVVGMVLGVGFAVALQRTLVDQGIEVLDIPWAGLAIFLVLAAGVGVLAALWPAYRAGKLDVLRAVTTE
jgi:putative ABC transport system permease protein